MTRQVRIAAVQMAAVPAPTADRLARAGDLIAEAASAGAQLVVLPELFNTGYQYDPQNYQLAETIGGQTLAWMHAQAKNHQLHVAGSLMLREGDDIYNSAFLIAPDGRRWRYDKQHPWLWERAYFRAGSKQEIAHTDLGDFGILICWDAAHPHLWGSYAGKVDALLVISSPPKMSAAALVFPDGVRVPQRELGGLWTAIYTDEEYFPGVDLDQQAGWLGVPVAATVGAGTVKLKPPAPRLAFLAFSLFRPDLWRRWHQAKDVVLETGFDKQTKVVDGGGQVVSRMMGDGDGFTLAQITLPDVKPTPRAAQPRMHTAPIIYFFADHLNRLALHRLYRRNAARS